MESEKKQIYQSAPAHVVSMGKKLHIPLMKWLQRITDVEDKAVPDLCLHGMPIVGEALESPFFEPFAEAAEISVAELLKSRPFARQRILDRFEHCQIHPCTRS